MADVIEFNDTADVTLQTLETIASYDLRGDFPWIIFELSSSGGSVIALDQFQLQVKVHKDAAWEIYISDWSSLVADTILWKSGTLNTLAHAGADSARVYLGPVHAIRFQSAQAGVTASAVTVRVRGRYVKNG